MTDFREKLTEGFSVLRRHGYFARQNWKCCNTCGLYAIPEGKDEKFVFYHAQSAADLRDAERTGGRVGVYLNWGGSGDFITHILRQEGLNVKWDGDSGRKIWVGVQGSQEFPEIIDENFRARERAASEVSWRHDPDYFASRGRGNRLGEEKSEVLVAQSSRSVMPSNGIVDNDTK